MANIIFQSSLPRAGSTLLQNLLAQNPLIYSTPTSNLINFILGARIGYNKDRDVMLDRADEWKTCYYDFCKSGIQGYIKSLTDKPIFLDKNRDWGNYYPLISNIVPNPKVIFMVRDLRDIMASMEKKFRANPDIEDGTQDNVTLKGITTQQRVEVWMKSHPVGYALTKLQQSLLDKTADNFLFIRYEDLCTNPDEVISGIYDYLNLDKYPHNYNFVEQVTEENDVLHGIYGDHTIRNKVQALPNDSREILGDSTYNWIYENNKEYFQIFKYSK